MRDEERIAAASARTVLGACKQVYTYTSADGVKSVKLEHGWWDIKAYDSEVYWQDGPRSDLDHDSCDRVEPTKREPFCSYAGHEHVTVEVASGGTAKIVLRDN